MKRFYKAAHKRRSSSLGFNNVSHRPLRAGSIVRLIVAVLLTVAALFTLRQRFFPSVDPLALRYENIVRGNCLSIEALRHADECFETIEHSKGKAVPNRKLNTDAHLEHEEDIPWISPYGLVLDYDVVYDGFAASDAGERYTTKRTMKCLTGYQMSIVWDIQHATSLLDAYKSGLIGQEANTPVDMAPSCPASDTPSSASMSIKINCGYDIRRDIWGSPETDNDWDELETCVRMAWSWVKGRIGDQYIEPWAGLCTENSFGDLRCDRERFQLEAAEK